MTRWPKQLRSQFQPASQPTMHFQRETLHNELHARPSIYFSPPAYLHHFAFLGSDDICDSVIERLCQSVEEPLDKRAAQGIVQLGGQTLKWERHTEFFTLTLLVPRTAREPFWPAPPPALAEIVSDFRDSLINANLLLVEDEESWAGTTERYGFKIPAGSEVGGGDAIVWSDFRLTEEGICRILIINRRLNAYRLGRMARRLLEIETYRMMASLALPLAHELNVELRQYEEELTELSNRNAENHQQSSRPLLAAITSLSARLARSSARSRQRFSATEAYSRIVFERIEELREAHAGDCQRLGTFILRRFRPTVRYCAAMDQRLVGLGQSVAQLSDLLQARTQVEIEEQNTAILRSLNDRASTQLKIQRAVEGLSIIVISYYIVSLFKLSLEGLTALGLGIEPRIAAAIIAPIGLGMIGAVAWHIWKIKRH